MANAGQDADERALRLAAHDVALSIPSLLQPLNAGPAVTSRRAALRAALDVAVAPPGYRGDLLTCLGMTGAFTTAGDVTAAVARLATGVIGLLEANAALYAALLPADLLACLTDGTLHRYVAHLLPSPDAPRIVRASDATPTPRRSDATAARTDRTRAHGFDHPTPAEFPCSASEGS
jgi:phosphoribosyl-AMP cyclohydrolase